MIKVRNKLTYHRLRNVLSQRDVAEKLGISQAYYGRLERNPLNMKIGTAMRLKEILKVDSIEELIDYSQ